MKKHSKVKTKNKIRILSVFLLALVIVLGVIIFLKKDKETITYGEEETVMEDVAFDLGDGLLVTKIGNYNGRYMEDASDDEVTDVLAIMVTNTNENALQYAEITLTGKDGDAVFALSTLNPDESVLVLESTRKSHGDKYTEAFVENVVFFEEELNTYEDVFEIQPLDGGFNITNISEKDVKGEIIIYFKDYIDGVNFGGITYRGRIEGGLKSGEIRQVMTENFSETNTKVMFITVIEE